MFCFRLIDLPDGNQVIDGQLKTPVEGLTPLQLLEYTEIESKIAIAEYFHRKEKKAAQKKMKNRKSMRNLLQKVAYILGII